MTRDRVASRRKLLGLYAVPLALGGVLIAFGLWARVSPAPAKTKRVPAVDEGADSLAARKAAQQQTVKDFKVFYGFQFTDQQPSSGITFVQHFTDDSGKYYKADHYDHGNGIAVADVDGDGLYDIYFVNQLGGNELWRNLGDGKFENITETAGVAVKDRISVTASFADINNDGAPDLYVTTVRGGNVLFVNDGKGHFKDISKESGLDYVGHSSGAVFFDYNNDGLLDLYLVNVGKYTSEERGRGGYFIGYPDAFAGHLHPERTEKSRLYKNQKGEKFIDKTDQYFPKTSWGAMGVKFFDYDNDGKMDLIVTDMHSDMSEEIGPEREKLKSRMQWTDAFLQGGANNIFGNAFYHNLGNGK